MKIRYEIVIGYSRGELESSVEGLLSDGWQLVGGVALGDVVEYNTQTYLQAMTKTINNE